MEIKGPPKKTATTDFKQGRKLVLRSLQSAIIMIELNYRQQAPKKLQEQQQQQQRRQNTTNNRQHWQIMNESEFPE